MNMGEVRLIPAINEKLATAAMAALANTKDHCARVGKFNSPGCTLRPGPPIRKSGGHSSSAFAKPITPRNRHTCVCEADDKRRPQTTLYTDWPTVNNMVQIRPVVVVEPPSFPPACARHTTYTPPMQAARAASFCRFSCSCRNSTESTSTTTHADCEMPVNTVTDVCGKPADQNKLNL